MTPANTAFSALLLSLAQLMIVLGGFCLMIPPIRRFGARLLALAVLAVVASVYGPGWLPH